MNLHSAIPVLTVMNFHHGLLDFFRNRGEANMSDDAREQSVKAYFDGLAAKEMSRVPWARDATLRTPLNPAGGESALIRGRNAILEFFHGILPAVASLRFLRYYVGDGGWAAGQAEISLANGKTLCALDAFLIENGEIIEQQNHYDPRPAIG
jgi:hypothetical protein